MALIQLLYSLWTFDNISNLPCNFNDCFNGAINQLFNCMPFKFLPNSNNILFI